MNNAANTGTTNESNVSDAPRIEPLPSLNDDDIEKILQPNDIFTTDRTDASTTSSTAIEDIINPSLIRSQQHRRFLLPLFSMTQGNLPPVHI